MRKYKDHEERAIRTERLVRDWTRSGLLEKSQEDRMLPELKIDLRRTNLFLRLVLFGFGLLIFWAAVLLVGVAFEVRREGAVATLCVFGAAWSVALAEYVIARFRLYRFGIEEAAAVAGGTLLAVAAGMLASTVHVARPGEFPILAGLIVGSIAAFAIYLRFGYLYAAIASMLCVSTAPFAAGLSAVTERLAAAGILAVVFAIAWRKRRETGDEFPGKEYGIIQAVAWMGIYGCLNLQLSLFRWISFVSTITPPFYWFTYAVIWILPAVGMVLGFRKRDRALLDVSLFLGLFTLATNKPYLGAARQTWDPILLGVFLIGTVLAFRRWLSIRDRNGLTATRILLSEKRGISVVATASAALHAVPQTSAEPSPASKFEPGGGASGGAGASGSF